MSMVLNGRNREQFAASGADIFDDSFRANILNYFFRQVSEWIDARPAIAHVDSLNPKFFAILLRGNGLDDVRGRGEIQEAQSSHEDGDHTNLGLEIFDIAFYTLALIKSLQLSNKGLRELDYNWIASQVVRRIISTSNIYDHLRELTGDMEGSPINAVRASEEMLALVFSLWRELQQILGDHLAVMIMGMLKNTLNNPVNAYSDRDPVTGELLTPDELELRFSHAKKALRSVRATAGNPSTGLPFKDYISHQSNVLNFRGGQTVIHDLSLLLTASNGNGVG